MINEQASSPLEQPIRRRKDYTAAQPDHYADIRAQVEQVMTIRYEQTSEDRDGNDGDLTLMNPNNQLLVTYSGTLTKDSEQAYDELDTQFKAEDRFPLFRQGKAADAPHIIHVVSGRVVPVEGKPWINLLLFLLTLASVWFIGSIYGIGTILESQPSREAELLWEWTNEAGETLLVLPRASQLWRGAPYALSIMLILGAHELGHYFAARHHKHAVSLPYFIPMPFTFLGTMGAFIRSREPMRNRKVLIDIGAAGPLAGLVFAIPIVFYGLATSPVQMVTEGGLREGNSLLYALAKIITKGQFYPSGSMDVFMNQMALAGWLGLLVTALNLIPLGQLDGGHVMYSLFGPKARSLYFPVMALMVGLAFISQVWVLWVLILLFLGRVYAQPLDDITTLDPRRRWMAIITLVFFVLVFVPVPFSNYTVNGEPAPQINVHQPPMPVQIQFWK